MCNFVQKLSDFVGVTFCISLLFLSYCVHVTVNTQMPPWQHHVHDTMQNVLCLFVLCHVFLLHTVCLCGQDETGSKHGGRGDSAVSKGTTDSGVVMDNRDVPTLPGAVPRKLPPLTFVRESEADSVTQDGECVWCAPTLQRKSIAHICKCLYRVCLPLQLVRAFCSRRAKCRSVHSPVRSWRTCWTRASFQWARPERGAVGLQRPTASWWVPGSQHANQLPSFYSFSTDTHWSEISGEIISILRYETRYYFYDIVKYLKHFSWSWKLHYSHVVKCLMSRNNMVFVDTFIIISDFRGAYDAYWWYLVNEMSEKSETSIKLLRPSWCIQISNSKVYCHRRMKTKHHIITFPLAGNIHFAFGNITYNIIMSDLQHRLKRKEIKSFQQKQRYCLFLFLTFFFIVIAFDLTSLDAINQIWRSSLWSHKGFIQLFSHLQTLMCKIGGIALEVYYKV